MWQTLLWGTILKQNICKNMCKYYLNCGLFGPRKKHGGPFGNPKLHVSYTYFSLSQTNLWNKYFDVRILWCKTLFLATSPPVVSLIYLRNQPNYRPVRKPGNKWYCDLLWNWATCICFFKTQNSLDIIVRFQNYIITLTLMVF